GVEQQAPCDAQSIRPEKDFCERPFRRPSLEVRRCRRFGRRFGRQMNLENRHGIWAPSNFKPTRPLARWLETKPQAPSDSILVGRFSEDFRKRGTFLCHFRYRRRGISAAPRILRLFFSCTKATAFRFSVFHSLRMGRGA